MSQTDFNVANASGASVRADLNAHFDAMVSLSSGATAPSVIFPNQWWLDTSTNILKQRNDANTAWVNVAGKAGTNWQPYRNGVLLGDASIATIGTSGNTVPKLNTANIFSAVQTFANAFEEAEATAVASAATTDIWATTGNTIHVTGIATITSMGAAPQAGAWRKVIFDGILTLTHGSNLNLPGSANITTAVNDFAYVYADTVTLLRVIYFRADGNSVVTTPASLTSISNTAITAVTNMDITGFAPDTYDNYDIYISNVKPGTDNQFLNLETSSDGGSTFDNASADYDWAKANIQVSTVLGSGTDTDAEIRCSARDAQGNAVNEHMSVKVTVWRPGDAQFTHFIIAGTGVNISAGGQSYHGWGQRVSAADVDALRFSWNAGLWAAQGTIQFLGIVK